MVVVQTPQAPPTFPPDPVQVTCINCQAVVTTVTEPISGLLMWMVVGGICIIGCCLCMWIPCCIDSLRDVQHKCPRCNNVIGRCERVKF